MPRKKLKINHTLETLSILDERGNIDGSVDPKLDGEMLLYMHRLMLTTRMLDDRMLAMQRQGRIGTFPPVRGQEATQVGAVLPLRPTDWMLQAFREPGCCIHRGWPVRTIIQFWGGYEEGCVAPEGVNDTPVTVPVASQLPHVTGVAWAMKMKGVDTVALGFVGDGGTSEGDFHEALTFAGVYEVPAVFVIANNQWAISLPRSRQSKAETLAQKAIGYGFDGIQVDGNDVLAVYVATRDAIEKARKGGGPTLIEAVTYRLAMHTTADDPRKYRNEAEVKKWEKRDPLLRFDKYLRAKGVLDDATLQGLENDIQATIKAGVEEYEANREADPRDCFKYLYQDMPAELVSQAAEFEDTLRREGVAMGH
ncbi:MAG: pyruvate dehydrogenase (acetyl-transferring) E1 component subunit alpha [Phycisphaerae bacterium]